jgi:zinc protease
VILHEDHSVPVVSVDVWYHVGSAREKTGRTGFAHLFEHLMFMGSGHVKPGEFDEWLEGVGGSNNGSTEYDRTNYWINVPSNALDLALFLESDRMGYLLDSMSPAVVDAQRDVVKNERRQSVENQPYGTAEAVTLGEMLYPAGHPYHWPVIGYMDDLTAASYDDVVAFFKQYYSPANASLVVAGDLNPDATRKMVEKWFSDVKPASPPVPMTIPGVALTGVQKKTITDRVQLPRLYMAWLTPPQFQPGDAALDIVGDVLSGGKNSRLYKRLVYVMQIAHAERRGAPELAGAVVVLSDRGDAAAGSHGRRAAEGDRRGDRQTADHAAGRSRAAARRQPDRIVVLQPHGAGRRVRRQGGSAQRLLHQHGRPRLVQ